MHLLNCMFHTFIFIVQHSNCWRLLWVRRPPVMESVAAAQSWEEPKGSIHRNPVKIPWLLLNLHPCSITWKLQVLLLSRLLQCTRQHHQPGMHITLYFDMHELQFERTLFFPRLRRRSSNQHATPAFGSASAKIRTPASRRNPAYSTTMSATPAIYDPPSVFVGMLICYC